MPQEPTRPTTPLDPNNKASVGEWADYYQKAICYHREREQIWKAEPDIAHAEHLAGDAAELNARALAQRYRTL